MLLYNALECKKFVFFCIGVKFPSAMFILWKRKKNLWQRSDCRFFSFNFLSYSFAYNYFLDILDQKFSNSNVFFKQNYIWALIVYMENSSLLFSSCHLKLVILEKNRLLLENNRLFVKITSKKLTIFRHNRLLSKNRKL